MTPSNPCPNVRFGKLCGEPVKGWDPMATCASCQASGAPARLWAEACPWARDGKRCNAPVPGVDPMRTCEACRRDWGAPARVPWRLARPAFNVLGQPWPTDGQLVMVLANAGLINQLPAAAPSSAPVVMPAGNPRDEVGSFAAEPGPPEF